MEVTRVPTKHTSIRCCSQVNKQKQGFILVCEKRLTILSRHAWLCSLCSVFLSPLASLADVLFPLIWYMPSLIDSCHQYIRLHGEWLSANVPCAFWRHAEPIYSRRCIKFSGNSPLWAEVPCCSQSFSLMPVSQPASWRKIQMSIKIRLWLS